MDYEALMDERQKHVHEHFSPNSKLNDPEFVKKLLDWITFWRRNPAALCSGISESHCISISTSFCT